MNSGSPPAAASSQPPSQSLEHTPHANGDAAALAEPDDPDERTSLASIPGPPSRAAHVVTAAASAPIPIAASATAAAAAPRASVLVSSLGSSVESLSPSPSPSGSGLSNIASLTVVSLSRVPSGGGLVALASPTSAEHPAHMLRQLQQRAEPPNVASAASAQQLQHRAALRSLVAPIRAASPTNGAGAYGGGSSPTTSTCASMTTSSGATATAAGGVGVGVVASLKVLCSAAICRDVSAFKGAAAHATAVPPVILKRLLRAVLLKRALSDETMGFFLAERLLELELDCSGNAVSDAAVGLVPLCCPHLKRLAISNAPLVTDKSATLLANLAPPSLLESLTSLSLVRCDISDDGVLSITAALHAITALNVSGCARLTAASFDAIGRAYGSSLESLHARGIALTSGAVQAMAKYLSAINVLDISVVKYNPQDPTPDEESLCSLVRKCGPSLRELSLSGQPFTDRVMQELALAAKQSLQMLELSWPDPRTKFVWSVKLTNAGITHLANHCTNIKQLGLAYCSRLDDQAIIALGRQLHFLEKINLTGIAGVTDKGISELTTPSMKRLKLRDCIVNSISLFNIASYCPNLEYLDVRSSTFPSEESFKAVARSCPQLTTLLGRLSNELVLQLQLLCPRLQVPIKRHQLWEQSSWEAVCAECWGETAY